MKPIRRYRQMISVMIVSMLFLLNIASGCGTKTTIAESTVTRPVTATPGYIFWEQHFTGYICLKAAEGELNGDEKPDLLVIYHDEANECFLVAVINSGPDFQVSEPFAAPLSDQVIDIFDMDGTAPNEFSVSGRKGVNIGSAVFRLENGQIVQLFSSGYGDCC
jgi:hypothetical protein